MLVVETMLGKLGSRFTLHFPRTTEKCVYFGPLGKYYDRRWDFRLGLRARHKSGKDYEYYLPYTTGTFFSEVEQALTMTSIRWKGRDRSTGLRAEFTLTAPYYPGDIKTSTAPFFYLDVVVQAPGDYSLEMVLGLSDPTGEAKATKITGGFALAGEYRMVPGHWGPRQPTDNFSDKKAFNAPLLFVTDNNAANVITGTGSAEINIAGEREIKARFIIASYVSDEVLEIRGEPYCFKYREFFRNPNEVLAFARQQEHEIRRKTALFDSILGDSSLNHPTRNLIAFSFQSFVPNTWWAISAKDSPDWFSCWEGNCTFHSTVDVEYNLAWVYLLLWPDLLEMTLSEWRHYLKPVSEEAAFMSHDIGALLGANSQAYPHEMEVEESANFILLVYALWRYTAKKKIPEDNREVVSKLASFILNSATTASGFPTEGTANTVDDASPAVQFGREQTYLAVKALAALHAATFLLEATSGPDEALLERCRVRVEQIIKSLNQLGWLDDHYAVCLDRTTDGLINPWSSEPLEPGELFGWNAYSLYTSNGLLYLLATGVSLPAGDYERFKLDIINARRESLTEYGCYHSSVDHSHIWVSQNLHRDHTGAFLGIDPDGMPERYWAYEQYENSTGRGGCFVDTYGPNHLRYYPRGITSLGYLVSLPGAKFDRVAKKLTLSPVRIPLKVPLLTLADWQNEKIPWVEYNLENGEVKRAFTYPELVEPYLQ